MKQAPLSLDIRGMAGGNTDALARFYRTTGTAAYSLALSMLRNRNAATEAVQEAYLTAYETASAYSAKETPMVWLLSIVYRQCCAYEKIVPEEDIPTYFSPVAALSCVANIFTKDIGKITGLSRKQIVSFKHLRKGTNLAAFCESIPEQMPDLSQSIVISALLSDGGIPATLPQSTPKPKHPSVSRPKWLAFALPVLAVLILVGFGIHYVTNIPVATTVYLDGGLSIRLELDENDRVLNVQACDDVSKLLMQGLALRYSSVDTAMEKIVAAMVSKGYLKDHPDALLLSVSQPSSEKEETKDHFLKYQQTLLAVLEQKNLPTVLLSQALPTEYRVSRIAEYYHISPGRAGLVHRFVSNLTIFTDTEVAELAEKSPFYFCWLLALQPPTDASQIHFSQTEKMAQYFSKEEILSRALYLLTRSSIRLPGSSVSLSNVTVDADDIQTCYDLSLDLNGNNYHLKVSAWTGYIFDCTQNGEPVSLDFYSDYAGLEAFLEKEQAISLAIAAAGCDADSVVFCTAKQDWTSGLLSSVSSVYPSFDSSSLYVPGKYRVTFYSADMYTHYCVDVIVKDRAVLGITKTETPVLPGGISPRKAVSLAVKFTGYTEDAIIAVSYESNSTAPEPYYVIHLQFLSFTEDFYVDMVTGTVSMLPKAAISKDEAIQIAANLFDLTPESVLFSPELSVNENEAFYRVTFADSTMGYRADVDLNNGQILHANSRALITLERAYNIVEEAAGISSQDKTIRGSEMTDSEYIIQLYHSDFNYVSRVCRNTGVILYFDDRFPGESMTLPLIQSVTRTQEEALQLALDDAFSSVDTVNQITVSKHGDFYSVSFIDLSQIKYTYSISAIRGENNPILRKASDILFG